LAITATVGLDRASAQAANRGPLVSLTRVKASGQTFTCARQLETRDGVEYCKDGDLTAHRSLLLVGDSHARHWAPAFAQAAKNAGVTLLVRWRSICPPVPIAINTLQGVRSTECDKFHAGTESLIRHLHPNAVVLAQSDYIWDLLIVPPEMRSETDRVEIWGAAYESYLITLRSRGIAVGAVVDTPRMQRNPIDCLAEKPADRCGTPKTVALGPQRPMAEAEVAARSHLGLVPTLDINGALCGATTCGVMANGTYVYVDDDHLYRGFVLTEVPVVESFIRQMMT
jgi:SGNH domain (fused to AT3 domains)